MTIEWTAAVRRRLVVDGIFSKLMDTLTGGVFLAGLGLYLGADSFLLGVLASLPFLAQVAQFPTVQLLMRVPDRRRVVVAAVAVARSMLLLIAALLIFFRDAFRPSLLVLIVGAMALMSVVAAAAWNWWMRDLVPRGELGRFFGSRMRMTTLFGALALVVAGASLDWFDGRGAANLGYAALFLAGGLFGWLGVYWLSITPHEPAQPAPPGRRASREIMAVVKAPDNRALIVALAFVASTLTIALPFTAVFLLRNFNYSFLAITGLALASQLAYVASLRGWGYLSDRFGNRPVLQISVGLLVSALIGWTLTLVGWPTGLLVWFLLLHFVTGFAVGGIDLTGANIMLKTAPDQGAPAYFAGVSLTRALTAGVATLIAGAAWEATGSGVIATVPLGPWHWAFYGYHVLTIASIVVGIAAILLLRRVQEPGGARVHHVARAMRREVHMISSVTGIRAFVHVVSYVVEFMAGPRDEPSTEPAAPSSGVRPSASPRTR